MTPKTEKVLLIATALLAAFALYKSFNAGHVHISYSQPAMQSQAGDVSQPSPENVLAYGPSGQPFKSTKINVSFNPINMLSQKFMPLYGFVA